MRGNGRNPGADAFCARLIEALEAEEPATEAETAKIKDLIAALGG